MALIEISHLLKTFKQGTTTIKAVNDVSFTVNEGDFWAIIGPSGSGKSTMLQLLGALDRPTSGEIIMDGKDITRQSDSKLAKLRSAMLGFVFQNFNLIPTLTASQNVEAALVKRTRENRAQVKELLSQVGLESRINHLPSLLSGGEQTLTATALIFAMFLTNPSPICVLDEIDAPLDDANVDRVCSLMESIARDTKTRFIVITHHRMTMARMDRLYGVTMSERGVSQLVSVDLTMQDEMQLEETA